MTQGMIGKLVSVLETTLSKLSRYDEGSLIGSILSFTVCILMTETFHLDNVYTVCRMFRLLQDISDERGI